MSNMPPTPPAPQSTPPASSGLSEQNWCTLIHISPLISSWLGVGHIIVPLILWLAKKEGNPQIDATGRNVLNFQISFTVYLIVSFLLWAIFIGVFLTVAVAIAWVVLILIGTVKSSNGQNYIYPWCIRFL